MIDYLITELELKQKCKAITNKTINDLSKQLNINEKNIPESLTKHKGWVGQLIEQYLGATAKNKPEPDFAHLGIELKTLPLNHNNKVKESTYICYIPNIPESITWENSWLFKKLSKILWVPIQADTNIKIKHRKIFSPFLWSPTEKELKILQQDWEDLMDMVYLGHADELTAKYGTYLQVRPKAANSKIFNQKLDKYGNMIKTVPKGFYLRTSFTNNVLNVNGYI